MKIAVCVHLYHTDMWSEIQKYLDNLKYEYKLYVNIPINETNGLPNDFEWNEYLKIYDDLNLKLEKNEPTAVKHYLKFGKNEKRFYSKKHLEIEKKIIDFKSNSEIFYTSNVGMDIGGFLQTYKKINSDIDLILKIHTKLCVGSEKDKSYHLQRFGLEETKKYGLKWFSELMDGVLFDTKKVERIINEFEQNPKCGMVGYKKYNNFKKNSDHIQKLFNYFSFSVNPHDSYFVGGTIFWVKKNVLDQYLTHEKIDYVLNLLDKGYSYEPSFAHAMERMFAYFVYDQKKELIVIN
jgi:lipopolysaccharide biosynthesis protein